jgi:apolipoprotein N-acyltransferase
MKGLGGPLLLAALASLCLAFSNGADAFAPMAWIAPVLLLRLTRGPGRLRPFIGYAAFLGAWLYGWAAVLRLDGVELAVAAPLMAGLGFLPYLVDRWVARRLGGLAGTLVFPTATVAMELLFASVSPFGSWGMIGYSQVGLLPLAQLAALTGVYGLTFLPCWFASMVNLVLEERTQPRRWRWPTAAFIGALALVFGWGALRLTGDAYASYAEQIRVAALTPHVQENGNYDAARAPAIQDDLFAQTAAVAVIRTELVVWPEDSFFIPGSAEPALLARGAAAARAGHVSIGMVYGVRERDGDLRYRNRFVLVDAAGRIAWMYDKSYPVPGYEQAHMVPGNDSIAQTSVPEGLLVGAICFDGDHRQIMRQVAAAGPRLLLLPSDDWPAIVHLHAAMARMRAIEQGVPIVRPTINGIAAIYDGQGGILATRLSLDRPGDALIADLPLADGKTFYARFGDWFAWANIAGLAVLVLANWRVWRKQRRQAA